MSRWFRQYGYAPVGNELVAGALPLDEEDVERLSALSIDSVFNLCEDAEYPEDRRERVATALDAAGIREHRMPLIDYGNLSADRIEHAVGEIVALLDGGDRVYLHCRAGWQRSAVIAAAVIMVRENQAPLDALATLRRRKPNAEPLPHQRIDLLRWSAARAAR
jgi:protein-tyrosine phosphatase